MDKWGGQDRALASLSPSSPPPPRPRQRQCPRHHVANEHPTLSGPSLTLTTVPSDQATPSRLALMEGAEVDEERCADLPFGRCSSEQRSVGDGHAGHPSPC